MLDTSQKQALMETLRNLSKKASSNVSTKVEAKKGDYAVVVTADTINNYYQNHEVGKIRVAELNDSAIELINSNPQEAAQEMLESFANSFDVLSFTKTAETKTTETKTAETEKEAAHDTVDEKTWQMITQKQMDDQKPSLHPRTEDYYNNITQKQLPDNGQRPGTYEEITESQFNQEKSTFYNEPLTAGERQHEDRNRITESQFDEGTSNVSEVGQSDREQIGAKFDGDLPKQHKMIGEKQLEELLNTMNGQNHLLLLKEQNN